MKGWTFDKNIRHSVSSPDETPRSSSNSLLGVSSGDETLHLMFDVIFPLYQNYKRWKKTYSSNEAFDAEIKNNN